jgi:hypothetical protein
MSIIGGTTNLVLFAAMLVLWVFNFISLKKESRFAPLSVGLQVLPIPLTIAAYWVLFQRAPASPLYVYLLVAGLLLGLLMGALTRVYRRDGAVFCRRSRLYLVFWLLSLAVTQGSIKLVGTAAAGVGTAFMFYSLGMVLSQQLVTLTKAGAVNRRALAAAGVLLWLFLMVVPAVVYARTDPFQAARDAPSAYFLMAKDALARGDRATAIRYGRLVVSSTRSPGTQAKGHMVIWLAGGGERYADLARQGIINSGQLANVTGDRSGAAALIGLGIIRDIRNWRYQGYVIPPNANVIKIDGVFAVSSSQLPRLWEDLKAELGLSRLPAALLTFLDGLVNELANSEPVTATAAATSAAATSGILLISGLLNLFTASSPQLAVPGVVAGMAAGAPPGIPLGADSPYAEGRTYTFHDGIEYRVQNGHLVPVRKLGEGEVFIDAAGDRRIWVGNQAWMESDWRRQESINQAAQEAHRADWEKRRTTLTPALVEFFGRQSMALGEAQRLEYLARRIQSGRVNVGEHREQILGHLRRFIDTTRSSHQIDPAHYAELKRAVREALGRGHELNLSRLSEARASAWRWNVATNTMEYVQGGADRALEALAKVTGPKGRAILDTYRTVAAVGGGISQGYATGNWGEALVETGATLVDHRIAGSLKTDTSRAVHTVVRGATQSGYAAGREAYRSGDSMLGAAALGFLEGASDAASGVVKDSLEGGTRFVYTVAEGAVRAGYGSLKEGGGATEVLEAAGRGVLSGGLEASLARGLEHLSPPSGAVDDQVIAQHQWHINLQQPTLGQDPAQALREVLPLGDWRTDVLKDELRAVTREGFSNLAKGEGLPVDVLALGAEYMELP